MAYPLEVERILIRGVPPGRESAYDEDAFSGVTAVQRDAARQGKVEGSEGGIGRRAPVRRRRRSGREDRLSERSRPPPRSSGLKAQPSHGTADAARNRRSGPPEARSCDSPCCNVKVRSPLHYWRSPGWFWPKRNNLAWSGT